MRFGEFEIDLHAGELFRGDTRIRIQELPFRVLVALLERPNELVTREQLADRLWGADTFVDREAGLNTAVAKLREALGDNAETPRFIETLPKRGYRLRVPVEASSDSVTGRPASPVPEQAAHAPTPAAASAGPATVGSTAADPTTAGPAGAGPSTAGDGGGLPFPATSSTSERAATAATSARMRAVAVAGLVLLAGATAATAWWKRDRHTTVAVVLFHNETGDTHYDRLAQQLTDGTVVALTEDPALEVIGNAAILRTPRIFTDIQKVGHALDAEYVLLGQVQRGADGLLVRTHFVRVSDQKHLWAHPTTGDADRLDRDVPLQVAKGVRDALARRR